MAEWHRRKATDAEVLALGSACFGLGCNLLRLMPRHESFALSPLGTVSDLLTLMFSATGATKREVAEALYGEAAAIWDATPHESLRLLLQEVVASKQVLVKSALCVRQEEPVSFDFTEELRSYFPMEVLTVPLSTDPTAACRLINKHFRSETRGFFRAAVKSEDVRPSQTLLLVSTTCVIPRVTRPLEFSCTTRGNFLGVSGKEEVTFCLKKTYLRTAHHTPIGCQVTCIPCEANQTLFIVLPEEYEDPGQPFSHVDPLITPRALASSLTLARGAKACKTLLQVPKLTVRWQGDLAGHLNSLGAHRLFKFGQAQLTHLDYSQQMVVNLAIHGACFRLGQKVDDTRPEVAQELLKDDRTFRVTADRPFYLVMQCDVTSAMLMLVRVLDL